MLPHSPQALLWVALLTCIACGDASLNPDAARTANDAAETEAFPPESTALSIATFNLLHGFPSFRDVEARTEIVAEWIARANPDIIAVQEAAAIAGLSNRGEDLAAATGYHWTWTKASGVDGVFEEGPGILSKWPIESHISRTLPHPGASGFEVRAVVGARVRMPSGPDLSVFSAHLTTQDDEQVKLDQAKAAWEFATESDPDLMVLAGDMNATPESPAMRWLRSNDAMIDLWQAARGDAPGLTVPARAPERRIDYLYYASGEETVVVESCELIFAEPSDGLYASDHLGVLCTLQVPENR